MDENIQLFSFPDEATFVCGISFAHRNFVHYTGGYNFKDLMERKYSANNNETDMLLCQHAAVKFENGKLIHSFNDLNYSRLIGASCVYSDFSETAYCFGGIHEEVGFKTEEFYVSNLLVSHSFRDTMSSVRTFISPIGVIHPPTRVFHCSAFDHDRNSIWIYGGGTVVETQNINDKSKNKYKNDLWEYQLHTQIWILHQMDRPLSAKRWGQSMVYFNRKLYLFGGSDKIAQNNFWVFDLADIDNIKWKTYKIPDVCKFHPMGCGLQLIEHPKLGPRMIITGGCYDPIYRSLGYSVDLKVEQTPTDLDPLNILSYDPIKNVFEKVRLPKKVPNVSYHGVAKIKENLFLIGGLNHCDEGRSFCRKIIRININKILDDSFKKDFHTPNPQSLVPKIPLPHFYEIKKLIQAEYQNVIDNPRLHQLKEIYKQHSNTPFPTEDFTPIHDQWCNNLFLIQRSPFIPNFSNIPSLYAEDFVCYIYTGMIHENSKFDSFSSFLKFISFCWKLKFYRLILLEICHHIDSLLPEEILTISSLSLDSINPLVDEPQFDILKNIMFTILQTYGSSINYNSQNIFLISNYFIPLLDDNPQYPAIKFSRIIPSTVIHDLSLLNTENFITCNGNTLHINYTNFSFDPKITELMKVSVIIAVVKLSLLPLLGDINDIFSAFVLINSNQEKLSKHLLNTLLSDSIDQIEMLLIHNPELKQLFIEFLPSIKHRYLLELVIKFIGHDSKAFILDKEGRQIKFDKRFTHSFKSYAWIQLDLSFKMLNVFLFILYSGINPENIQINYKKKDIAQSLFAVYGEYSDNAIFKSNECINFIKNNLINKETLTNNFIVRNFTKLFRLNFIEEVVNLTKTEDWIDLVADQVLKNPKQDIAAWYLFKRQILKSPGSSPFHSSSEVAQTKCTVNV